MIIRKDQPLSIEREILYSEVWQQYDHSIEDSLLTCFESDPELLLRIETSSNWEVSSRHPTRIAMQFQELHSKFNDYTRIYWSYNYKNKWQTNQIIK